MYLNQDLPLFGSLWDTPKARLHFIENPGMAFGWELGNGEEGWGKPALTIFRLIAVTLLSWFIHNLIKKDMSKGVLFSFALILAGAAGNIIDSAIYGMIFEASPHFSTKVAGFTPWGEGYSKFLYGKVVDMFYFPLFEFTWPEWVPRIGGNRFEFFRPVFNLADAAITVGVFSLVLFNRSFFAADEEEEKEVPEAEDAAQVIQDNPEWEESSDKPEENPRD